MKPRDRVVEAGLQPVSAHARALGEKIGNERFDALYSLACDLEAKVPAPGGLLLDPEQAAMALASITNHMNGVRLDELSAERQAKVRALGDYIAAWLGAHHDIPVDLAAPQARRQVP